MKTNALFTASQDDIDALIARHPLAQVISISEGIPICTPLPLLLERDGDEAWLVGHFARANPQVEMLRRQPRALAVFMGEHGYVSPSWMRDRTQAPTWNFATAHLQIEVQFQDGAKAVHAALGKLVAHMELGRPNAWHPSEMGERYAKLATAVIAFRARILDYTSKFKLGQNERGDVFEDIVAGFRNTGSGELANRMVATRSASGR